jgi:large conductance mechanosensitive channel
VILALINVLVIAFVMYLIVRAIEAMRRKEEAAAGPDPQAQLASAVTG